jgi:hypothetical protein
MLPWKIEETLSLCEVDYFESEYDMINSNTNTVIRV